jgi:hypothetical protein
LSQLTFFLFYLLSQLVLFPFDIMSHLAFFLLMFCLSMFFTIAVFYVDNLSVNQADCISAYVYAVLYECANNIKFWYYARTRPRDTL